jgi:hypothetical protein
LYYNNIDLSPFFPMFDRFWQQYPQGSILSDLVQIHNGTYVVRVTLSSAGQPLVATLAAAEQLETAQFLARSQAMQMLGCGEIVELLSVNGFSPLVMEETPALIVPSAIPDEILAEPSGNLELAANQPSVELAKSQASANDEPAFYPETEQLPLTNGSAATPQLEIEMPVETSESIAPSTLPLVELLQEETAIEEPMVEVPISSPPAKSRSKKAPVAENLPPSLPNDTSEPPADTAPLSVTDIIPLINMELKRLNWSREQGRDYMVALYNKRASSLLSDEELFGLLQHLRDEQGDGPVVDQAKG